MRRVRRVLALMIALGSVVPLSWAAPPAVDFEKTFGDFGILPQGSTVQFNFSFLNRGGEPLRILSVQTSCGCAAAVPENPVIAPSGSGTIRVTFDSRGKMGETVKQIRVRTNDPKTPVSFLTLAGKIVDSRHPETTGTQHLFSGACRECHADRGERKTGETLYMADCAMCHESAPRGGPLIGASAEDMALLPKVYLQRAIAEGVPNTSMPAFAKRRGGPLTAAQTRSLVDYLKSLERKSGGRQ